MKYAVSQLRRIAASLATAVFVVSCGGGIGGVNVAGGGIGGTGVTAVSVGPITQFGSIFVNGVEYDLKDAAITVNDQLVTNTGDDGNAVAPSHLALGQVVKVQGTINTDGVTGTAAQVTFSSDVNGPITSVTPVDATTVKIVVLGQTVIVDNTTQFKNLTFNSLATGIVVEVSGLANSGGDIHATFVEKTEDSYNGTSDVDVKGTIQFLDSPTAGMFMIKQQPVDYITGAPDLSGLPNNTLANGQFVEVTGYIANGILVATKIKSESEGFGVSESQQAEIEGFVNAITSSSDFTVGAQPVHTTGSTVYRGGLATDIAVGVKVEIEGALQGGILTATKITFRDSIELNANVNIVDSGTNSLTLTGLSGITVTVNNLTHLDGVSSLGNLQTGANVKVRGRPEGTPGTVIATELEKESSASSTVVTLQGPVDDVSSSPLITVVGLTLDASHLTGSQILTSLHVGDVVQISGTLNGSAVNWTSIEKE
jgi:hypothetical protein